MRSRVRRRWNRSAAAVPGIGAEIGDLELEPLDAQRADREVGEHEPADARLGVERERQPACTGGAPVESRARV